MLSAITLETSLQAVTILVSIGTLLSSAEYLALWRQFSPGGLFGGNVTALAHTWTAAGRAGRTFSLLFSSPGFVLLAAARLFSSALLIVLAQDAVSRPAVLLILFLTSLALHLRCFYGLDGADQMSLFVVGALLAASLARGHDIRIACLWLIAAQACLAYFVSGTAKLLSSDWRRGYALLGVLTTRIYGNQRLYHFFLPRRRLAMAIAWMLMCWEAGFPLLLFGNSRLAILILCGGVLFHLSTALVMGLNTFFWAFVATFPALLYCVL